MRYWVSESRNRRPNWALIEVRVSEREPTSKREIERRILGHGRVRKQWRERCWASQPPANEIKENTNKNLQNHIVTKKIFKLIFQPWELSVEPFRRWLHRWRERGVFLLLSSAPRRYSAFKRSFFPLFFGSLFRVLFNVSGISLDFSFSFSISFREGKMGG